MAADHLKYVQMCTQTGETSTVSPSLSCSFLFWGWSSRRLCVVSCLASMKRAMPAICVSFVYMVGWTVNTCTCWWRGKLSNIRSMYMHTYIYMDMWVDAELDLFEVGYHLVQTWQKLHVSFSHMYTCPKMKFACVIFMEIVWGTCYFPQFWVATSKERSPSLSRPFKYHLVDTSGYSCDCIHHQLTYLQLQGKGCSKTHHGCWVMGDFGHNCSPTTSW